MRAIEWGLVGLGVILGYVLGWLHIRVIRVRRAAAWRDRALRHH